MKDKNKNKKIEQSSKTDEKTGIHGNELNDLPYFPSSLCFFFVSSNALIFKVVIKFLRE